MTEPTATPTADKTSDINGLVVAGVASFVLVALVAGAASLMMSFHGLRDLVERVEDVHGWLSNVGPIGIDGLQLASFIAIIATVGAPFRVRLYLWFVFFGSIGLSVLGNALDAAARHAGSAGIVMSAVWPALLAAATHVVVMAVRWWKASYRRSTAATTQTAAATSRALVPADAGEASEPKRPTPAQIRARARTLYQNDRSCRQVAEELTAAGIPTSDKQVERWTQDIRRRKSLIDIEPTPEPASVPA